MKLRNLTNGCSNMKFSERMGYKKPKSIQIKNMDIDLRTRIWNLLITWQFRLGIIQEEKELYQECKELLPTLYDHIITEFYKQPIDLTGFDGWNIETRDMKKAHELIRKLFFESEWYKVYELIEFLIIEESYGFCTIGGEFLDELDCILEEENSAYRLVIQKFIPIIDSVEIQELEKALVNPYKTVRGHLKQAYDNFSDKTISNYRISAEESIKAVESMSKIITGKKKATLGDALKILRRDKEKFEINELFINSIEKLWAWASDTIRHGKKDEIPIVDVNDSKFILIICSGIINYLTSKFVKYQEKSENEFSS